MRKAPYLILYLLLYTLLASAQLQTAQVGSRVGPVELRDGNNEPLMLPHLGEKHLLVFYVDPDKPRQNSDFTDHLEDNQIISDNIFACGVVNLKDAPMLPNAMVRSMARKKERKTGQRVFYDPDHSLRDAWGLGDVNNLFVLIFVTRDGHIAYLKKGKLSQADIDEFYKVVERYI